LQYLSNQTNTKGKSGGTILHYACDMINYLPFDVFKILIETMSCDVNAQDNHKDTPLHLAICYFDPNEGGNITVLTYLINQTKVHLDIKGKNGNTLLHYACEKIKYCPLVVFKLLIGTHGADVNAQNNDDDTPLHNAFRCFDPNDDDHLVPVLQYLLSQKGVNFNIKDQCGRTFLHLACIWDISDLDEFTDSEDDGNDLKAKSDTVLSHIVEIIAERCVEQVFNESSS
jgi:ankyrin repeat protein